MLPGELGEGAVAAARSAGEVTDRARLVGASAGLGIALELERLQDGGSRLALRVLVGQKAPCSEHADEQQEGCEEISRATGVSIMVHVDHGKTSLLDYIRNTKVAGG